MRAFGETTGRRGAQPRRWRGAKWLALFAILYQAVVPIYAMAALGGQSERIPVCTGSGIVWIALKDNGERGSPSTPPKVAVKLCPFCISMTMPFATPERVALPPRERPVLSARLVPAEPLLRALLIDRPQKTRAPPLSA